MDTPFPFPLAQFSIVVVLVFAVILPIVSAAAIDQWGLAMSITFISVLTHFSLYELARDLEDPFIYDPNDLPLARNQWAFNEKILALSMTQRPISTTEQTVVRLRTLRRDTLPDANPAELRSPMSMQSDLSVLSGLMGASGASLERRVGGECAVPNVSASERSSGAAPLST